MQQKKKFKNFLPNFLQFFFMCFNIWSYIQKCVANEGEICLGMLAIVVMAEVQNYEKKKTGFVLVFDLFKILSYQPSPCIIRVHRG
jgi:hypothetical protein